MELLNFEKYNNTGIEDFDGLSPKEMHSLLYLPDYGNIIKLNPGNHPIDDIPFIKQIRYFTGQIDPVQGLKLTKAGNIPPVFVKSLYSRKYIKDEMIETGITKLTKETDSNIIVLIRLVSEMSGLVRKKNNTLFITKKHDKIITGNSLFPLVFTEFCQKFNWSYFDGFENEKTGQFGHGYTIYLLHKYGDIERPDEFYANKYFKALPDLKTGEDKDELYNSDFSCFSVRSFERFLAYFGFIEIRREKFSKII